jgi:hypothetical protein
MVKKKMQDRENCFERRFQPLYIGMVPGNPAVKTTGCDCTVNRADFGLTSTDAALRARSCDLPFIPNPAPGVAFSIILLYSNLVRFWPPTPSTVVFSFTASPQ